MRVTFAAAAALAITAIGTGLAVAQTTNWIGPDGGNWSANANWSNLAPYGSVDAVINNGGSAILNKLCCTRADLDVGSTGFGTLSIQNGGRLSSSTSNLGRFRKRQARASVEGLGSSWTNSSYLWVGYQGSGLLAITSGRKSHDGAMYWGFCVAGGNSHCRWSEFRVDLQYRGHRDRL